LGEANIEPYCLEGALNTYIATGRFDSALNLISKKYHYLPDMVIFDSLKILHEKAGILDIASICYELILKGMYSSEILSIVMRSFKGTVSQWLKLANKIDSLGFDVSSLYEKIIVNGIFISSIDNDSNEAFLKLSRRHKEHPIIAKYAYFCCYEIIKNGKHVSDALAEQLELLYYENGEDKLLCYALALTYIRAGRQDKAQLLGLAAAELEEDGIVLPQFKEYQDKSFVSSYIEKHSPFVYSQQPNKNIYICYKPEGAANYEKKPLKYFRFGMYLVNLTLFYGDKITYYFEEESGRRTAEQSFENKHLRIVEQFNDSFYAVNNLIIYENMMKFDMAEKLIEQRLSQNERSETLML
jgi:hypothetical protein